MTSMMQLKVGDTVVITDPYSRTGRLIDATVTKVGHKWVHFSTGQRAKVGSEQIYRETGTGGTIYRSREELEASQALNKAWDELKRAIADNWTRPEGVTLEAICEARRLLGLEAT